MEMTRNKLFSIAESLDCNCLSGAYALQEGGPVTGQLELQDLPATRRYLSADGDIRYGNPVQLSEFFSSFGI